MVAALHSFAPHHEEEEEKILTLDTHLTIVNPRQNRYTPNDSKWATPLQVAFPSFYRPRRRAPYNVGSFPPTYLPICISYIHVHVLHNVDLPIFPGFLLVAENPHDNVPLVRLPLVCIKELCNVPSIKLILGLNDAVDNC